MRVVITGMGVVSCLGNDLDTVSQALRDGRSGIAVDEERIARGFRSPLTGVIRDYDVRAYANRKQLRTMGEPAQYAVGAAADALTHAGLTREVFRDDRVGLVVGNDSTALPAVEIADSVREHGETHFIGTGKIIQVMNSTVSMNLATYFGVRGASWTVSGACASGAHAVGQAYMLIKAGLQHTMLCGGAQEINWQAMAAFDALGAFALPSGEPGEASRPFAADRRGLVPSGGAAMVVVESLERAIERGATILAEIIGYGFSSDGEHLTQPQGDGAERAMRMALEHAKIAPDEVDYINAHATSTEVGDLREGRAILEVFGPAGPAVSSTKSMTGHECWMAGASECVYSLLMMRDGFIAPNINLDTVEPALADLDIVRRARPYAPRTVLTNSFGFGGTNAGLLLRAFDGK